MNTSMHSAAPHHLPIFITAPGQTDTLMVVTGVVLIVAILAVGNMFLRLHTLPERIAHKSQKLQFEIVAVLGLIALFTHIHAFWVAGLILAMVDFPDFSTPLHTIAGSLERLADASTPLAPDHVIDVLPQAPEEKLLRGDLVKCEEKTHA